MFSQSKKKPSPLSCLCGDSHCTYTLHQDASPEKRDRSDSFSQQGDNTYTFKEADKASTLGSGSYGIVRGNDGKQYAVKRLVSTRIALKNFTQRDLANLKAISQESWRAIAGYQFTFYTELQQLTLAKCKEVGFSEEEFNYLENLLETHNPDLKEKLSSEKNYSPHELVTLVREFKLLQIAYPEQVHLYHNIPPKVLSQIDDSTNSQINPPLSPEQINQYCESLRLMMPLFPGKTLYEELAAIEYNMHKQALLWLAVIAEINRWHHELQIMHGDIKLSNMLCSWDNDTQSYTVKLIDTALGASLNPDHNTFLRTAAHFHDYDPRYYTHPERYQEAIHSPDPKYDIYSLCVFLLEKNHPSLCPNNASRYKLLTDNDVNAFVKGNGYLQQGLRNGLLTTGKPEEAFSHLTKHFLSEVLAAQVSDKAKRAAVALARTVTALPESTNNKEHNPAATSSSKTPSTNDNASTTQPTLTPLSCLCGDESCTYTTHAEDNNPAVAEADRKRRNSEATIAGEAHSFEKLTASNKLGQGAYAFVRSSTGEWLAVKTLLPNEGNYTLHDISSFVKEFDLLNMAYPGEVHFYHGLSAQQIAQLREGKWPTNEKNRNLGLNNIAKNMRLVMPKFPGETLDKALDEACLHPGRTPLLWRSVIAEVKRWHDELGIVHGDIKPANILCHWNEELGCYDVKLVDLGLGGSIKQEHAATSLAKIKMFHEQPAFNMPQSRYTEDQAVTAMKADRQVDIYGLCATMLYLTDRLNLTDRLTVVTKVTLDEFKTIENHREALAIMESKATIKANAFITEQQVTEIVPADPALAGLLRTGLGFAGDPNQTLVQLEQYYLQNHLRIICNSSSIENKVKFEPLHIAAKQAAGITHDQTLTADQFEQYQAFVSEILGDNHSEDFAQWRATNHRAFTIAHLQQHVAVSKDDQNKFKPLHTAAKQAAGITHDQTLNADQFKQYQAFVSEILGDNHSEDFAQWRATNDLQFAIKHLDLAAKQAAGYTQDTTEPNQVTKAMKQTYIQYIQANLGTINTAEFKTWFNHQKEHLLCVERHYRPGLFTLRPQQYSQGTRSSIQLLDLLSPTTDQDNNRIGCQNS